MSDQLLRATDIRMQRQFAVDSGRDFGPDNMPTVVMLAMDSPYSVYRCLRWLGIPLWIAVIVAVRVAVRGRRS